MHAREIKTRTHLKLELSNTVDPNESAPIKVWFVGRVYKMHRKFGNHWVEYRDLIDLMDHPSNMDIGLCCYQKGQQQLDLRSY